MFVVAGMVGIIRPHIVGRNHVLVVVMNQFAPSITVRNYLCWYLLRIYS